MKSLLKIFLLFTLMSNYSFAQTNSTSLNCTPRNSYTIPFQIFTQGNLMTLRMKGDEYQLSFVERYIDKSGDMNFLYKNDLLTVITSKGSTAVYTNATYAKDSMITFGVCK